jgi:tetratricopeptide (TPR) repeat protein
VIPNSSVIALLEEAIRRHQSGQLRDAEALYRQVLSRQPDNPDALHYLGVLAGQAGHHDAAIDLIRKSLALRPGDSDARLNLASSLALHALSLQRAGQSEQAIALLRESLSLEPQNADTCMHLGIALRDAGKLDEATAVLRCAVELNPQSADAHNNLGNVLQEKRELTEAVDCFRKSLSLRPDHGEALNNLGNALREQGRLDEAQSALRRALDLRPNVPQIHNNLANVLRSDAHLVEAIQEYRRAVALEPRYAEGWNNLGVVLRETGQIQESIDAHRKAIASDPAFADAHFALAFSLLLSGDFHNGWREYEWRLRRKTGSQVLERNWDGADLDGRTILLHAEQGFGDTIQFARYVPLVMHRGGKVIVACQRELVRLLGHLSGVERVISIDEPLPGFHVHCPLMSLPLVFGTGHESIPANVPYLAADLASAATWAKRVSPGARLNIGLAWTGRPTHPDDRNRSIPASALAPLAAVPNVSFHSLQPGSSMSGLELDIIDHTDRLRDFADTAALIANLDLVITADTAVAHLAGAMAKPVWLMLPFAPDWRWMLSRDDSPWYPTMRLFRQPVPRHWTNVIANISRALASGTPPTTLDHQR